MSPLLVLVAAMAISVVVIPAMQRLALPLGLIDEPEARKVHAAPVARVGGWGIVGGAVVALAVALSPDRVIGSFLWGVGVLFVFGAFDDRFNIGHYKKFVGQIIAVLPVVYFAGLSIERLPFGLMLAEPWSQVFTVFAMVGVINAINHADGLDGLAGGVSLLSLAAIVAMTSLTLSTVPEGAGTLARGVLYDASVVTVVACAAIGGLLGFLRYNTHPARVFMGDTGSQFLGFTVAFLVVLLVGWVNPALSPAVPALLIGLPIIDILAVLFLRVKGGMNWFKGTRNHVHHRLLDLGFAHQESVIIIYALQAAMVLSAIFLRYGSDALILGLYGALCVLLFTLLTWAERQGWRVRRPSAGGATAYRAAPLRAALRRLRSLAHLAVAIAVVSLFLAGPVSVSQVPSDFGLASAGLALVLGVALTIERGRLSAVVRVVVYACAVFVVYLVFATTLEAPDLVGVLNTAFYGLLAVAVGVAIRQTTVEAFQTTPMDYLVVFLVVVAGLAYGVRPQSGALSILVVQSTIALYGCELLFNRTRGSRMVLSVASLAALVIMGSRGLWTLWTNEGIDLSTALLAG